MVHPISARQVKESDRKDRNGQGKKTREIKKEWRKEMRPRNKETQVENRDGTFLGRLALST